ncbi:MAG: sigma-70 family RNA polymerase sigma factor [Nitriliruptorales bacterium]|nr:sigma-70 family RNA polymerase sigma factor [Nitriliruptorales bacterium]
MGTRRSNGSPSDDDGVSEQQPVPSEVGHALLDLYDEALPLVYGYLLSRSGSPALAEDLTAETFLAAAAACHGDTPPRLSRPWLVGVARHKLVDHWRRQEREDRGLRLLEAERVPDEDPWQERLDALRARQVLATLGPHHRAALTLRYLDDLAVPDVAEHLGRTVHATEALLVRARGAFRRAYDTKEGDR